METSTDRVAFFRKGLGIQEQALRPPWALPEAQFIESCECCDDCIKACPEQILVRGRAGFPQVEFDRGGCSFCADCLDACKGRALKGDRSDAQSAWRISVIVGEGCLSARGIICRSCGDVCDEDAIRFRLRLGGVALPELDQELCNACGACISKCPEQVINLLRETQPRGGETDA